MWPLQHGWNLMDRDPSCCDLASCDFNLVGPFKKHLAGWLAKDLWQASEIKQALGQCPWTVNTDFLNSRIQILVLMRGKCLNVSGDCFGVWCAPSATRVPCIHRSQSNVLGIKLFVKWIINVCVLYRCISLHSGPHMHTRFVFSALAIGPSQRQHTTLTRERHTSCRVNSNPQSQQESSRRQKT